MPLQLSWGTIGTMDILSPHWQDIEWDFLCGNSRNAHQHTSSSSASLILWKNQARITPLLYSTVMLATQPRPPHLATNVQILCSEIFFSWPSECKTIPRIESEQENSYQDDQLPEILRTRDAAGTGVRSPRSRESLRFGSFTRCTDVLVYYLGNISVGIYMINLAPSGCCR